MTTSKEAAAVALAEALFGAWGGTIIALPENVTSRLRAYECLRATPPPPDAVGELERAVVDAFMPWFEREFFDKGGEPVEPESGALYEAFLALRSARTPVSPLEAIKAVLDRIHYKVPGEAYFRVSIEDVKTLHRCIDAALAQKGGSRV